VSSAHRFSPKMDETKTKDVSGAQLLSPKMDETKTKVVPGGHLISLKMDETKRKWSGGSLSLKNRRISVAQESADLRRSRIGGS